MHKGFRLIVTSQPLAIGNSKNGSIGLLLLFPMVMQKTLIFNFGSRGGERPKLYTLQITSSKLESG